MPPSAPHVVLVGYGKMGQALAAGWRRTWPDIAITIVDPHALPAPFAGMTYARTLMDLQLPRPADAIILAVKPQTLPSILSHLRPLVQADILVLSIVAGILCDTYLAALAPKTHFVRTMPNTPAAIGQGITAAYTPAPLPPAQRFLADTLLQATGQTIWIDNEDDFDAITALSGSGPAYVFHMIEAMAMAGVNAGLHPDIAMQFARQTVIGSAALTASNADDSIASLRQAVTSPNGTTAAGLEVLMDTGALTDLMTRTIQAAADRSRALRQSSTKL